MHTEKVMFFEIANRTTTTDLLGKETLYQKIEIQNTEFKAIYPSVKYTKKINIIQNTQCNTQHKSRLIFYV